MVDLVDCNFEENLVFRFERISQEFLSIPEGEFAQRDIDLLNENTRVLNEELKSFKNLRAELVKSNRITPSLKSRIRDQFIPSGVFETYDRENITSVQNLVDFVRNNFDVFSSTAFSTEDSIFDQISRIDPVAFRPFGSEFPSIEIRLRSGPISSAEVDALIRENGFDPNVFESQVRTNRRGIFSLLERFLSSLGIGIGIMGSFCALVQDVFALLRGQRDIFGNPADFLNNFQNVLGLINPKAGEVIGLVQQLISLIQNAQQVATGIASNLQNILSGFSSGFNFGNLSSALGSINFGITSIIQVVSLATGIISSIRDLISGSKPVNIQGILQQLDQIVELGAAANKSIAENFAALSRDYQKTVEDALKEAEENSVDNPGRTAEINQKNQESLKEDYTKALEASAEASKNLGPRLVETVNKIRNGIRQLAAVGILENLDQQLTSVIDQAASQLRIRTGLFTTNSLDNGYHFNMGSSYAKMAGEIARAQNAASDKTTESMKDSVRGMIAQSAEKYQQKSKEEVEFIALRFCKLAGEIERLYRGVTAPLEQLTSAFREIDTSLSAVGNGNTLGAVRAGAVRYDTQTRLQAIQQSGGILPTIATPYINATGQRSITPGDGISVGVLPPLPDDYKFPTFEEALRGTREVKYGALTRGTARQITGAAGFTVKPYGGVEEESMRKLLALARAWGRQIQINSAYRNPAANAAVGGKDGSLHLAGKAFDCGGITSRSEQIRFMNLAYQAGFTGFGSYNSFVHIDTRGSNASFGNFRYYSLRGPNGGKTG